MTHLPPYDDDAPVPRGRGVVVPIPGQLELDMTIEQAEDLVDVMLQAMGVFWWPGIVAYIEGFEDPT